MAHGTHIHKKYVRIASFITLIVSIVVGIALIQNHHAVKSFAAQKIASLMSESFDCTFEHEIESFNLFNFRLTCKNIHVNPHNHDLWSWHCSKLIFSFSWLSLITQQKLEADITSEGLVTQSLCDNNAIPIADHFKRLFFGTRMRIPFAIRSLKVHNAILILTNPQQYLKAQISWDGFSKKIGAQLKSILYIKKGSILHKKRAVITYINGQLYSTLSRLGDNSLFLDSTTIFANKKKEPWYITGELHNKEGYLHLYNTNDTCTINLTSNGESVTCNGSIHTSIADDILQTPTHLPSDMLQIQSSLKLNDNLEHHGTLTSSTYPVRGTWTGSKNLITASFTNQEKLSLDSLTIEPLKASLNLTYNIETQTLCAHTICDLYHARCAQTIPINIKLNIEKKDFSLKGNIDSYTGEASGNILPAFTIKKCILKNPQKNKLGSFRCSYDNSIHLNSSIHLKEIRHLLPETVKQLIDGSGIFTIKGKSSLSKTVAHVSLKKGSLFLGKTYNMITDFSADLLFDHFKKRITIKNLHSSLHQGSIYSPHAVIIFNEQWTPTFISLPLTLKQCLIGSDKNVGIFSGSLFCSYNNNIPLIDGTIKCDKVHIHTLAPFLKNPSSSSFLLSHKPVINLLLEAKKPIRIKTDAIETSLYPYLTCTYENNQPHLTGTVTLRGGSIQLPYSRIKLLRGALHLTADNSLNPFIDLIAKTTIRNYAIIIFVGGTLKNPIFRLSSRPSLPEEQIASLILAGSKELSFNTFVPTLIFEYLKNSIIESGSHLPASKRHIHKLIKPLKYIKFTPEFTDETGSKGLSGGIELDIGRRMQAKIKKNITTRDEPALELNYRPTDALCFKAFKDEQGDIGSQVEMKFKW